LVWHVRRQPIQDWRRRQQLLLRRQQQQQALLACGNLQSWHLHCQPDNGMSTVSRLHKPEMCTHDAKQLKLSAFSV
jgi:hypothetical protein